MHYCNKFKESFSSYIEGEIAADARQVLESHLSACPACREVVQRMRSLRQVLGGLSHISPSADFEYRLNQRLRQIENQRVAKFPLNYFGDWKIPAVSFALVAVVFSFFMFFGGEPNEVNISTPQKSTITPSIPVEETAPSHEIKKEEAGQPVGAVPQDSTKQDLQKELNDSMKLINQKAPDK